MLDRTSVGLLSNRSVSGWRSLAIAALFSGGVAGAVYLTRTGPPATRSVEAPGKSDAAIRSLFERYKIPPLSEQILAEKRVRDGLAAVAQEPCDKTLIYRATLALENGGRPRESAAMLLGYADACPEPYGELGHAGELLYGLGDYEGAIKIADRLINMSPGSSGSFYLQARALKGLGRFEEALEAYSVTVRLVGNIKQVRAEVFTSMAASYASLGRFCEAMTPIQTYIAADSETRDSETLRRMIESYARQGNCAHTYASGSERLPKNVNGPISAKAEVNGVTGVFIIDTGASFVSVTKDFAKRAKLSGLKTSPAQLNTANGDIEASLVSIPSLRLGRLRADAVPGVILDKALGRQIDGLLGMSFLARFDMEISDKEVRIKEKRRN